MARLYDTLLAEGYRIDAEMAGLYAPYFSMLEEATVVVADDVTAYYAEHPPEGNVVEDMFPWLVPPISPLFVESRPAGTVGDGLAAWGSLLLTHDLTNGDEVFESPIHQYARRSVNRGMQTEARWVVHAIQYIQVAGSQPQAWMLESIPLLPDGRFCRSEANRLSGNLFLGLPSRVQRAQIDYVHGALKSGDLLQMPLFLALSFMHCKNVQRREVGQSQWDRRVWQKKHKRPLVRYHVLDIDPMRKVLRDEGGSDAHGLRKALHICRGHFATYTADAPLFGRVTGTFWKSQHVRGSAKSGVVLKDYNVKAPK